MIPMPSPLLRRALKQGAEVNNNEFHSRNYNGVQDETSSKSVKLTIKKIEVFEVVVIALLAHQQQHRFLRHVSHNLRPYLRYFI